ncbi:tetratricopeptide repeat-containing sensor histidine kinase [Carboxylicivirga mesophila]|uniref:histidine kinase n=1 Tax=Carboxylicivirga mesophila TaxID=1166478 RepID=A0ABS5KE65_9BACT|nr:tetratricopeptide repeat-containing sensor histidine kinase [Carboxylicivirga mesophila]MBS2213336.1 tetratricopeptide repeat-containing sensor histidine kinase [Carboxylicivirga mesophila]
MASKYGYLLLILTFWYIVPVSHATEQDSLSTVYLQAKQEAALFVKSFGKNVTFQHQLDSLEAKVQSADGIRNGAYYIQFAKKYIKHAEVIDSILLVAEKRLRASNCQRGLGEAVFYKGVRALDAQKVEEALGIFKEAAHIFKLANSPEGEVYCITRVANYYSKSRNYQLAEKYYNELLKRTEELGDVNLSEMAYLNVANFYNQQGKTDEAISYYSVLEKSLEKSNNKKRYKPLYNNLGVIYIYKKDWAKAKEYLHKSIAIKQEEGDSLGIFSSYQNLFRISVQTRQLDEAAFYSSLMTDLAQKLNIPPDQMLAFNYNNTQYLILAGEPENALREFDEYVAVKDSINKAAFSDKLLQIEQDYEIEKRDQAIALLQQKDELQQEKLGNLKVIIAIVVVFVLILLFNGFYMKRQWMRLNEADKRLKEKQQQILTINKRLESLNSSKDRILSVIGHDLRGPVGGLKELVELYMELPELEPQDITNLLNTARESSSSAYYLLENLLTWANSQRGEITFKPLLTPILPVVTKTIELLDQSINSKGIRFDINIEASLSLKIDINMFRTIIRNLVSNSIKHSPHNSLIEISAEVIEEGVQFSVVDQGHGMTASEVQQLFSKKEAYYISSDVSAKGTGLGLILCKEFVERHGGNIWVQSEEGIGTRVYFVLPVAQAPFNPKVSKEIAYSNR